MKRLPMFYKTSKNLYPDSLYSTGYRPHQSRYPHGNSICMEKFGPNCGIQRRLVRPFSREMDRFEIGPGTETSLRTKGEGTTTARNWENEALSASLTTVEEQPPGGIWETALCQPSWQSRRNNHTEIRKNCALSDLLTLNVDAWMTRHLDRSWHIIGGQLVTML